MVNAKDIYNLVFDPIDDNVWQPGKNQFACAFDPPRSATTGKVLQTVAAIVQGTCHAIGSGGIVPLNALNDAVKVLSGGLVQRRRIKAATSA
jgi:hypothetical protein